MDAIIERFIEQDVQKARLIAMDKSISPVRKICPVSYTHLDVYKRQADTGMGRSFLLPAVFRISFSHANTSLTYNQNE